MMEPDAEPNEASAQSSSTAPASWKMFDSVENYVAFMDDPSRILRLEWRKARRPQLQGITSHSWLSAKLQDGSRSRLELFADLGFVETRLAQNEADRESTLFGDLAAGAHEFARPLTAERLRSVAAAIAGRATYSMSDFNCHHFALEVWNAVVIEMLRREHYPDRVKTHVLWGVELFGGGQDEGEEPGAGLWSYGLGALFSQAPLGFPAAAPRAAAPRGAHARVAACHDGLGRTSGRLTALGREAPGFQSALRLRRFGDALAAGAVYLLEPGRPLAVTSPGPGGPEEESPEPAHLRWARRWLPGARSDVARRLAERMSAEDAVDLVAKALCAGAECRAPPRASDHGASGAMAFASLASSHGPGGSARGSYDPDLADACFVVLRGEEEVRLATYALLRPSVGDDGHRAAGGADGTRRLRLLSGDAKIGDEGSCVYTLCDHPGGSQGGAAAGLMHQELDELQFAVATNDWGFVTLL